MMLSTSYPNYNATGNFPYLKDALTFGRPGCGAPVRTRSGRLRTTLIGNPEIRFQPNESVQKTIVNCLRYAGDRETKEQYQRVLGELNDLINRIITYLIT